MKKIYHIGLLLLLILVSTVVNGQVIKIKSHIVETIKSPIPFGTFPYKDISSHDDYERISYEVYGYINSQGEWIIAPKYHGAMPFSGGLAAVKNNWGSWGYINYRGQWIIRPTYESVQDLPGSGKVGSLPNGLGAIKWDDKWGYVNIGGEWLTKPKYDAVKVLSENLLAVNKRGRWGYLDQRGRFVIRPRYEEVGNFSGGFVPVKLDGKWGVIDNAGRIILEPMYDVIKDFSGGLASVKLDGKWGIIDNAWRTIVEPIYDGVESFYAGFAHVKSNGKWGIVDSAGTVVIEPNYDEVGYFSGDFVHVKLDGRGYFVNKLGDVFSEPRYRFSEGSTQEQLSSCIDRYVHPILSRWQQRGEYEKTVDWRYRVNERTVRQKIADLTKEAEREYFEERGISYENKNFRSLEYDVDREVFMIEHSHFGELVIPVPVAKAESFKRNWEAYKVVPKYFENNNKLGLAELTFISDANSWERYKYVNSAY